MREYFDYEQALEYANQGKKLQYAGAGVNRVIYLDDGRAKDKIIFKLPEFYSFSSINLDALKFSHLSEAWALYDKDAPLKYAFYEVILKGDILVDPKFDLNKNPLSDHFLVSRGVDRFSIYKIVFFTKRLIKKVYFDFNIALKHMSKREEVQCLNTPFYKTFFMEDKDIKCKTYYVAVDRYEVTKASFIVGNVNEKSWYLTNRLYPCNYKAILKGIVVGDNPEEYAEGLRQYFITRTLVKPEEIFKITIKEKK